MDRRVIVDFIVLIGKFGMIVATLLLFLSFHGFMKDVDCPIALGQDKERKLK